MVNKMSDYAVFSTLAVVILLLSLFSIIYAYRKHGKYEQDYAINFIAALPGFVGLMAFVTLLFVLHDEDMKQEHLKEFGEGKRVFWCPENKESQKMNKVALSDGFIYDTDKDMFVNQNTNVAYSFKVEGRICR